ncbi:MAG: TFIIB-type zinc ribbon-containing protein [Lachnospiraceae bacterium]|nr:TFIIB-type zinc ribbon-containing protein [Lachnospiraceae bacterium]
MFKCPNCGGHVVYEPTLRKMKCEFCDSLFNPEPGDVPADADAQVASSEEVTVTQATDKYEANVFTCPQCGGEIISDADTAVTFCSYCGSSTVLEGRLTKIQKPDYVIPFVKTKEEAEEAYKKAISRSLFAPASLKRDTVVERFRGIYMPYWIYNFRIDGQTTANGTKDYRRGNYIYHDHYQVTSDTHATYDGISFDASSSFADSLSGAIAPYEIKDKKKFSEDYLAGFYADTSDISKTVYKKEARDMVKSDAANRMMHSDNYGQYGIHVGDALSAMAPDAEESNLGYFPVWFLSNRTGDRISYAVVNGQTGRVAVDIPISFAKYMIGALIIAVPLFFLMNLAFTITPLMAVVLTIFLGVISVIVNASQQRKVYVREHYLDDAGMQELEKKREREAKAAAEEAFKEEDLTEIRDSNKTFGVVWGIIYVITFLLLMYFVGGFLAAIAVGGLITLREKTGGTGSTKVVKKKREKAPFSVAFAAALKPLIGIVIALGVAIIQPVSDLYYYGAILVSMALILWSFFDMVVSHNRLATRPLPQFNKRGGDE